MSRRPVRRPRTARRLPGARRRETSRLTGKTVSRPEFSVSRFGFPVSRPSALPVGAPFMTPGARGGTRCRLHFARRPPCFFPVIPGESVSHPGVTSGAPTFFVQTVVGCGGVPCECVGLPAALPVGAPFMTPGARGGTRCRPHGARRYPRFFRSSRVIASVIRASQVAPLRFLCRRLWVAAAGHLADLRRLQSRQSI